MHLCSKALRASYASVFTSCPPGPERQKYKADSTSYFRDEALKPRVVSDLPKVTQLIRDVPKIKASSQGSQPGLKFHVPKLPE